MSKDYKISNDGTIFEIKEDGSISKIARIDDAGNISSISGKISGTQQSGKGKFWFFIVITTLGIGLIFSVYLGSSSIGFTGFLKGLFLKNGFNTLQYSIIRICPLLSSR